jgi:hypothetical protein
MKRASIENTVKHSLSWVNVRFSSPWIVSGMYLTGHDMSISL